MPNADRVLPSLKIAVQRRNLISLPREIREQLNIREGDVLEARVEDGKLIMEPYKLVPAGQAYFWSKQTQQDLREAEQDVATGQVRDFANVEEYLKGLDNGS